MKTIVPIPLVIGLCAGISCSQVKARERTCTEGIFTFKAPLSLTKIQGRKAQNLKSQMMQGGRELAEASGTADPELFTESFLTFFSAYELAGADFLFVLVGDKSPVEMNREEMFNSNAERIRWGKNAGQLSGDSKGVSKLDIDGIPSLLMDIVSSNGERLQTYTFFIPDHPKHSFAITLKTSKEQHQSTIDGILGSLKLARTKTFIPTASESKEEKGPTEAEGETNELKTPLEDKSQMLPGEERADPGIVSPGVLGEGWLMLPPPEFRKAVARGNKLPKLSATQGENWATSLRAATSSECSKDEGVTFLIGFLSQTDFFWQDDQFQVPVLDQTIVRLGKLSVEQVGSWVKELNKVTFPGGGGARHVETVGYLLQMERLFRGSEFIEQASSALLARVRSVPKDAVDSWKEIQKCTRHQAVIMLIQDDRLFRENLFQKQAFEEILRIQSKLEGAVTVPDQENKEDPTVRNQIQNDGNQEIVFPAEGIKVLVPTGWQIVDLRDLKSLDDFTAPSRNHLDQYVRKQPDRTCCIQKANAEGLSQTIVLIPGGGFIKDSPEHSNMKSGSETSARILAAQLAWLVIGKGKTVKIQGNVIFEGDGVMIAGKNEHPAKLVGDATMLGFVITDRWQALKLTIGIAAPPEHLDGTIKTLEQIIRQIDRNVAPATSLEIPAGAAVPSDAANAEMNSILKPFMSLKVASYQTGMGKISMSEAMEMGADYKKARITTLSDFVTWIQKHPKRMPITAILAEPVERKMIIAKTGSEPSRAESGDVGVDGINQGKFHVTWLWYANVAFGIDGEGNCRAILVQNPGASHGLSAKRPEDGDDKDRLQGVWEEYRSVINGIDGSPLGKETWTFDGDRLVQEEGGHKVATYTCVFHPNKAPKQIILTTTPATSNKAVSIHGIYRITDTEFVLCYFNSVENKPPPETFESKYGSGTWIHYMKRRKP